MGACLALEVARAAPAATFPGASWDTKTPTEVDLDEDKLNELAALVGGDGCIVRYGFMSYCWGSNTNVDFDWGSAAKPVLSTLLWLAVDEGLVSSVDETISNWGWSLASKDQTMTFRHLANMTSGYARGEVPGQAWAYNDYAIALYAQTLERVFQTNLNTAFNQRMSALEFQNGGVFGSRGGHGVLTSIRDFARIGWFWLNRGRWGSSQIIPESFFDNYLRADVPGNLPTTTQSGSDYLGVGSYGGDSDQIQYGPGIYGFNWWFNEQVGQTGNLAWPDAPPDTFQANGHWGSEVVIVIPSLSIVVSALGLWGDISDFTPGSSATRMNQALALLVEADVGGGIVDTIAPAPPSNLEVN